MTVISKKFFFTTLIASLFALASCNNDSVSNEMGDGTLHIELGVDGGTEGVANTRAEEDELPSIDDFALSIYKGSEEWRSFDRFSSVPEEISMPIGIYTVKASYGEIYNEGFDAPYYAGSEEVEIKDDDSKSITITCTLGNCRIYINYTDAFKAYFKDYSAELSSGSNSPITFGKDETRPAYFKPGSVDVNVNVTKAQGATGSVKLFGKTIQTEARHEYHVTLDVDAGSSQLTISFDDSVDEDEKIIDVSDDALNANPPVLKAIGFENGQTFEVFDGKKPDVSKLQAYINAASGLNKCLLKTSSASLKAAGWDEEIDLISATDAQNATLKSLGLTTVGLGANREKIALVDFTNVIPNIAYDSESPVTEFTINVVDNYSRMNEEPLTFKVETKDNLFAASDSVSVKIGATKVEIPVTLAYDPSDVLEASYLSYGKYRATTYTVASSAEKSANKYVISVDMSSITNDQQSIRLQCGSKYVDVKVGLENPTYEVKALSTADVWSDKATLTLVGESDAATSYIAGQTVTIKCQKDGSSEWITPTQKQNGSKIEISGFASDVTDATKYAIVASFAMNGGTASSETGSITTEAKTQLPNNSFESWETVSRHNGKWSEYYPWSNSDASSKGWDTMNLYTIQADSSYEYGSTCGTRTTTGLTGNGALVSTVGWGSANTQSFGATGYCYNKTPGELYLGSFNSSSMAPEYGMSFASRPSSLSFYYKYTPYSTDAFIVNVVVENRSGDKTTTLATASFTSGTAVDTYTLKTINLSYTNTTLNATHLRVEFKSGTDSWSNSGKADNSLWLEVPPTWSLSTNNGKYVASQLYIDDVTLGY